MDKLTEIQIERLRNFSDCIVMHPQIKTIFNDFDELRQNRKFQSDQQCMLLTGDTGVGKSHLIKHYRRKVAATQNYSRNTIPILISRISRGKGFDSTLNQMLGDLELFGNSQRKQRGVKSDLTKKLVGCLITAQVELLIINEFQEMIEFKTIKERQEIANGLKYISEEAQVPIVLVGMPWAEKIADEPQWSSRLIRRRKLEYFSFFKERKYYRNYLIRLAKYIDPENPPKLENEHIAKALFASCRGENRALKHLLSESLKLALSLGEHLEIKHFISAFDKLYLTGMEDSIPKVKNPFKQNIKDIVISEVIKNSKYNPNAIDPEHILIGRVFS
jgi:hypothetical protein